MLRPQAKVLGECNSNSVYVRYHFLFLYFLLVKSLTKEITERLWCDQMTITGCQWFVAEQRRR